MEQLAQARFSVTPQQDLHHFRINLAFRVERLRGLKKERSREAPTEKLQVVSPYDESKEAALYSIPSEYARLEMEPDRFAIFFPEDAHMPNCHLGGPQKLHKIVVKASLDCFQGS